MSPQINAGVQLRIFTFWFTDLVCPCCYGLMEFDMILGDHFGTDRK